MLHIYDKDSHGRVSWHKMAEATGGQMLEVQGDKLEAALDEISDELHHQYSLGYYAENKSGTASSARFRFPPEKGL